MTQQRNNIRGHSARTTSSSVPCQLPSTPCLRNLHDNAATSSFGVVSLAGWVWVSSEIAQLYDHLWFCLGWRVDSSSPVTISTSYRWVTIAVNDTFPKWPKAQSFALFPIGMRPSGVLSYYMYRNGPALSPESQELIAPGEYGIFTKGK